jgi:hypothetical protein
MEKLSPYFYYERDAQNRPIITNCLMMDNDGVVSRGLAVCSPKDSPSKKLGRALARKRCQKAMMHKRNVMDEFDQFYVYEYNTTLNDFEKQLCKVD